MTARSISGRRGAARRGIDLGWRAAMWAGVAVLMAWTVFPFLWILLTSLKQPSDIIAVPPVLKPVANVTKMC